MSTVWLPTVEGPRDLPDLRGWLLDHWRPGTVIADIFTDSPWVRRTIQAAHLWWIEEGACDVLAASAPTIPADHTLDLHDLPTPCGLAIFASDLEGLDADPQWDLLDGKVRLSGIMWGPVAVKVGDAIYEGISIGSLSRSIFRDHTYSRPEMLRAYPTIAAILAGGVDRDEYRRLIEGGEPDLNFDYPATGDVFSYLGRSDWLIGAGPDDPLPGDDNCPPATLVSKAEDRRLLAALWALTHTSITEVTTPTIPRPAVRRAQRAGTDPTVRVLSLGGERIVQTGGGEPAAASSREYRHSWIVSPHFRWQACGPGRTERKLTLINAYMKGDPALPLLGTDRVWRVLPPRDR